ncbi:MAG: sugar ABC transporter permease [Bacilli bacterium]|nr:sugar ABC transporter permease [Bacilli bacterium]
MEKKNDWRAWLYLAPVIILLSVFTFYPLISTIVIAFTSDYKYLTQSGSGFDISNFAEIFASKQVDNGDGTFSTVYSDVVKYAIPNTLIIVFVTVPLSIIVSLMIAVGLNSIKAFKKIFQTIFFMPYVTNAIAVGMVFAVIFNDNGLWNYVFRSMGTHWIDQGAPASKAMVALCIYSVWHALPYKILIFLSGLQNIDKQYYQAASVDAAGKFKTFMNVTVPLLSPQILYIMITSFIGSFKEYSSIVGLFGGPGTLKNYRNMYTVVYYIYDSIAAKQVQVGCAAAVMLFIVILIFTGIQFIVSSKRVHY